MKKIYALVILHLVSKSLALKLLRTAIPTRISKLHNRITNENLTIECRSIERFGQIVSSALIMSAQILVGPAPVFAVDDQCTSTTSAISGATIDSCRRVGLVKGRLRSCGSSENCFSTAATAAGKYIAPWTYEGVANNELTADDAWKVLKTAAQETGLKVLQDKELGSSGDRYMLAAERGDGREKQPAGSSLFYELVLRADDRLILQRAFVDKTVFLYPLQQPVSDFGALKSRLDDVQRLAGFLKTETE